MAVMVPLLVLLLLSSALAFDDLGWCPILAQPWVKSDTNGFKEKMVPLMAKPMV